MMRTPCKRREGCGAQVDYGHADATPRFRRNGRPRRRAILAVAWSLPTLVYLVVLPDRPIEAIAGETRTVRIHIEYVSPTNRQHQQLYELLKQRQAFEKLQEIFSPFRLPRELTLRTIGCNGVSNAWYQRYLNCGIDGHAGRPPGQ